MSGVFEYFIDTIDLPYLLPSPSSVLKPKAALHCIYFFGEKSHHLEWHHNDDVITVSKSHA